MQLPWQNHVCGLSFPIFIIQRLYEKVKCFKTGNIKSLYCKFMENVIYLISNNVLLLLEFINLEVMSTE